MCYELRKGLSSRNKNSILAMPTILQNVLRDFVPSIFQYIPKFISDLSSEYCEFKQD